MGLTTSLLPPATQIDALGIHRREQDCAIALLSSGPLFVSQVAALEPASATPSPESEEWKNIQNTIVTLREEIKKLRSENLEMAGGLEVAEASLEALCSHVLSLKEANATQTDDIKTLRAELIEADVKYDRLVMDSNAERAALRVQVLDPEVRSDPCLIVD